MATDLNKCGTCGWQEIETEDEFNPQRMKCPECGAPFHEREEIRWFL